MGFQVTVFGKDEFIARFASLRAELLTSLTEEMLKQMTKLADYVRANKLSGDPLHRRSGRLSRSVSGQASSTGTVIVGTIGSKGVPYAAVHENGGTFQIPSFVREQTVAFGRPMIPKQVTVKAHDVTYPKRAFLKPSLQLKAVEIREALRARAMDVLRAST